MPSPLRSDMRHHPTTDCRILATRTHKILPSTPNVIMPCIDLSHPPSKLPLSYRQLSLTSPGSPLTLDHLFSCGITLYTSHQIYPPTCTLEVPSQLPHDSLPAACSGILALSLCGTGPLPFVPLPLPASDAGPSLEAEERTERGGRTPATHTHTHTVRVGGQSLPQSYCLLSVSQELDSHHPPISSLLKATAAPSSLHQSWVISRTQMFAVSLPPIFFPDSQGRNETHSFWHLPPSQPPASRLVGAAGYPGTDWPFLL